MVNPFELLAQGVVGLFNTFSDVLNYLNPFSENFILKGVLDFLGNILSYINPFSDNFILKGVLEFLGNLVSYVNPFSENFLGRKLIELFSDLFKTLFIPKQDQFTEINNKFNEKFGFFEQVKELVVELFSFHSTASYSENNSYPSWNITYQGTTVSIVDFSLFDKYRGTVHGIIIGTMYISFCWRLFRRLPGVINAIPNLGD